MSTPKQPYTYSDLVLVTGANCHVGQHVVDQLLRLPNGPRVRGTVRSNATARHIISFYNKKGLMKGRLDVVVVPDIIRPGAFDEAVKGVTHIAHVASPFISTADDIANDLLKPTMQGTVGILRSALRSPTVKNIVVTGSFASVFEPKEGWRAGYTYTASDWNSITFEAAASPDLDLKIYPRIWRPFITYCASKVVAERAAWNFQRTHSPHFSLAMIIPTYIGGPNVLPLTKGPDSLSFTQDLIWQTATDASKLPRLDWLGWVDVRDVAKAHVNALIKPEAAGKRWIVSAGLATFSDIADIIRRNFPFFAPSTEIQTVDCYDIDSSPALEVLGLGTYIKLETTVIDMIRQVFRLAIPQKRN